MKAAEIREKFLKFFESKGHTIVRSSSLVPGNDPTLMFTNSGMVQFKDVFLGTDPRPYSRATTAQRSVRAGGKHNDLENVGYTARHHTFFEMLGNFSFGDYFKHDAIKFAWELLTTVYQLPKDKLWVTVYQEDDEAYDIWAKEVGVPTERIIRIGDNKGARYASDNFWTMGDTGPCGPCTEIFYDHGPDVWGGPPGSPEEDGDRYIEIWNLVFMQFNRDAQGNMTRLPKQSVDTGMGLERLAAVLQHVHSNYEIDLFQNLIKAAARVTEISDLTNNSLKVIADHIRACSFLIVDGVIPGNEGRGYVLRRIVRRAIRHGYKLGRKGAFFHKLVADLVAEMGTAYPELKEAEQRVTDVLRQEEERFFETIEHGMSILEAALADVEAKGGKVLDGELAFKLHDTYGFPLDLTADVCRERGMTVDEPAFDDAMARQREQARAAGKFKATQGLEYSGAKTTFHGYEEIAFDDAKVVALYVDGSAVNEVKAGQDAVVVLDHTPFYAESGGQVGDQGVLANAATRFAVADTLKVQADVIGHHGTLEQGTLKVGDVLRAEIDAQRRARTQRNHSATHLMHKALREVLGAHVQQKGSLVDADKTRFDFAHNAPMTDDEIRRVEQIVNDEILANAPGIVRVMPYDEAVKGGAMALFGEKYGDEVRVLDLGFSRELCGGTHVHRTGDIGLFKIVVEGGVAAGIRRVEAITGDNAVRYVQELDARVNEAAAALKAQPSELTQRIAQVQEQVKSLEKELGALKSKLASSQGDELAQQAVEIGGVYVLAATLDGADAKTLRETVDKLKDKLKSAAIVLAAVEGGKVSLIAGVTPDASKKVKAGELVNFVAQQVGGKGGGRPDMAQAGGTEPANLPGALAGVKGWVEERL
ncbi:MULTISPECIES: alanine--tRNA ligase [Burkholderia]|uniref:Alanine--tRNA ligase n=2 Tax=Burkholderia cepacia complex TaxID=87882 RepID=SYA_BURO0|nr:MULTISPECIES: alanine--tRNA ligase [Burkholderia]B1K026.1 RecName: Full=Alanine--tRNA ligase; AltName: Full=Alanyl-tRNA synthetase; Short=AlaRS [Burkholderia orbicola MC0-3]ACA90562.1 alanyl-tRNA synthetase [Burkholderia orbicola MC0-3]AWG30596.1 alanine--tRNA ligase [Burkholderia cenocepacia]MBR8212134.1 alanine--tRNA ligase [Burkholderia cenocepacia]MCA8083432.1 alanine--tRNA ligase [Burkholderia cenocepacia]MCA8233542.1 alanine--tRNA ligase [Burkholderia cenocepacia]